jgi:two-component system, NarL family, sensor histidine kinase UhpB
MDGGQIKNSVRGVAETIIILDQNGIVQWASPSVYNILGYLPEEIFEMQFFGLVHKASVKKLKKLYNQILKRAIRVNEGLMQFVKKDGEPTALFVTFNNLSGFLTNGTMVHFRQFRAEEKLAGMRLLHDEAELEIELRKKIEREIAAELHDHVNPTLSAVKLIVDYSLSNGEINIDELGKIPGILENLITLTRNLSHSITKKAHGDFNLHEALSSLIANTKLNSDLRMVLKYDKSVETLLKMNQKVHLVRIIQEQILNIIKHAAASKVLICFEYRNERIFVVTKDNGKGFDPDKHREGIGLSNMYYRVNLLGGNIHFNSKCNEGTTITIAIPVD